MGTGYVRNDVSNNIASGNIINASDLDGEFDAIVAAFSAVTGHTHDGTAAEGAPITVLGPSQDFVGGISDFSPKLDSTYDLGKTGTRWANAYIDSLTLTTDLAVVDGGTGASTASAARTNLGVAIGTDVQAYDAGLQSISGLTTAADTMIYTTALDTYATTSLTPFARTLLDDTNAVSARATLGAAIGTNVQAWDANLDQIAALTPTDSNFIVGNGSAWVAESGATVRTSLGFGSMATQDSTSVSITGGSISGATISTSSATITGGSVTGITDLAIADGGTGASTASGARTNLGVAIGSDVQAWDANLDQVAALTPTDNNFIVGNGTAWVAESGATALTSLGITAAGQALLDDATASDQLTTLGVSTFAKTILDDADAEAARATLSTPIYEEFTSTSTTTNRLLRLTTNGGSAISLTSVEVQWRRIGTVWIVRGDLRIDSGGGFTTGASEYLGVELELPTGFPGPGFRLGTTTGNTLVGNANLADLGSTSGIADTSIARGGR